MASDFKDKQVQDAQGLRGRVTEVRGDEATVLLETGERRRVPLDSLREEGGVLRSASTFGDETAAQATASKEDVIPVAEEKLTVGRRERTSGGVRLNKTVHEHEEVVDEPSFHEEVEVERVSVGRVVDGPVEVRHEGDTTIYPVLEETVVVEKRLVLKEEIRVSKKRVESRDPQRVTLRREEVEVEDLEPR